MSSLPIGQNDALKAFNKALQATIEYRTTPNKQPVKPMLSHTRALIDSGYDINTQLTVTPQKSTPLGALSLLGESDCVDLLLKSGANPNMPDGSGETPYQDTLNTLKNPKIKESQRSQAEKIKISLLKKMAELNLKPYPWAIEPGDPQEVQVAKQKLLQNQEEKKTHPENFSQSSSDYLDFFKRPGKRKLTDVEYKALDDKLFPDSTPSPKKIKQLIVKLIAQGFNLTALYPLFDETNGTLLHRAAGIGGHEVVRSILEKDGKRAINVRNSAGEIPKKTAEFVMSSPDLDEKSRPYYEKVLAVFKDFDTVQRDQQLFKKMPYLYKKYNAS